MKYQLKKAIESAQKEEHSIVKKAKNHRVENYKTTVLFLES